MIAEETIDKINGLVAEHGLDEDAVARLRGLWPEIHFTYCSDDDVCGPPAVRESEGFNIYLVDSRDHCLSFTADLAIATGLVLAEHEEDF
jgi:hypothetical protein